MRLPRVELTPIGDMLRELIEVGPRKTQEGEDRQQRFKAEWSSVLHKLFDEVFIKNNTDNKTEVLRTDWQKIIDDFLHHRDHGIEHSYYVAKGCKKLLEQDKVSYDPQEVELLAVIHDLAQLLPLRNFYSGRPIDDDARARHARTMAELVMIVGRVLKLQDSDLLRLAKAVQWHDDGYVNKTLSERQKNFSPLAAYLADADKLFGTQDSAIDWENIATIDTQIKKWLQGVLARNAQGANNQHNLKNGQTGSWYFLRPEIHQQNEDSLPAANFWYGDRWWMDRVAAVMAGEIGMPINSPAGQQEFNKRLQVLKQVWPEVIKQHAQGLIEEQLKILNLVASRNIKEIQQVAKAQPTIKLEIEQKDIKELINQTFNKEIEFNPTRDAKYIGNRPERIGQQPKGWFLAVQIDSTWYFIDPSVARFCHWNRNSWQLNQKDFDQAIKQITDPEYIEEYIQARTNRRASK